MSTNIPKGNAVRRTPTVPTGHHVSHASKSRRIKTHNVGRLNIPCPHRGVAAPRLRRRYSAHARGFSHGQLRLSTVAGVHDATRWQRILGDALGISNVSIPSGTKQVSILPSHFELLYCLPSARPPYGFRRLMLHITAGGYQISEPL